MDGIECIMAEQKAFLRFLQERISLDLDPYLFILEVLGAVFKGAREAGNMGGSEPGIIEACCQAVIKVIEEQDPSSVVILTKPTKE